MDKIAKALRRLSPKERAQIRMILLKLHKRSFAGLDLVRLTGHKDIFRIRKGNIRIIFRMIDDDIKILAVERRNDTTYRNL